MKNEWNQLDLIDLISERHVLLRGICENAWNRNSDIYISNSEWYIMARIYGKQPTISYVSKHVNISRQATHKFIKSLHAKGLLEVLDQENNKKDKVLRLTSLGEKCYEANEKQKQELEKAIAGRIGAEKLSQMKEILQLDWGLTPSALMVE